MLMSELTGPPGPPPDLPTIWGGFAAHATSTAPDTLALACAHQPAALYGVSTIPFYKPKPPYLRWTFREFHDGVHRLAAAWRARGVGEGSMVVTFALNGAEWMLAAWAAIKLGCILMPISPRNLSNAEEVAHMVQSGLLVTALSKPPIVLAGSADLAALVDKLGLFPDQALKIVISTGTDAGRWVPFERLMALGKDSYSAADLKQAKAAPASAQGGAVLFTSGTTSLPKGVFLPWDRSYARSLYGLAGVRRGSRVVGVMPNNHAMGVITLTSSLMSGAAIVLPGPAFEPASMLETLYAEKGTHSMLVPTMIYALVAAKAAHPQYEDQPLTNLESIMLGGAGVTAEHLRLITEELGAKGVENLYGCTEGLFVHGSIADASEIEANVDGEDVCAGKPAVGYRLKVVDPATGETVPRDVFGEVHGFGWGMNEQYVGGVGKDAWYEDSSGLKWYRTGDQGRVDELGRLFITGRYKDIIIRGGENISPGAIEAILAKHPLLSPLLPQIVGTKDSIAGEVPVAVILGKATAEIRERIQRVIVQHLGAICVPEEVISISDLGLDDYPRTMSGKIQKTKIRSLVDEHLSKSVVTEDVGLPQEIKSIWASAVGLKPSQLRLDAPVAEFADSITVMRVRQKIIKQTGITVSLAAMAEAGTVEKQIKLLQSMEAPSKKDTQKTRVERIKRPGPPGVDDMAHLGEDPVLFKPTKELVVKTISEHGLGWNDVEDIMPVYDFNAVMTQSRMFESWTWEFALAPTTRLDKTQLRRATEAVVLNNRLLASYLVWDPATLESDIALHVVVRQSPKFFDLIFADGGQLETTADLSKMVDEHSHTEYVKCPGPMFRVLLYDIKETGGAAILISVNHSVIDATFVMQLVMDDLDRAFALAAKSSVSADIMTQLPTHIDYKVWADSYYNLRTSSEARAATKWHVKRLKSIADHVKVDKVLPPWSGAPRGTDPIRCSAELPDVDKLRSEHPHVTPMVLVKAAVALMEVERTGYTHAVFHNLEAARTNFPFMTQMMLERAPGLFEGTDVGGPTFQTVFNVVEVDRSAEETVLEFLERMQEDQTGLTKHASAPLKEIVKEMERVRPGAGNIVPKLINTPLLNWLPGLTPGLGPNPYSHMKMVHAAIRPASSFVYEAGFGGENNLTLTLNMYGAKLGDEEEATLVGKKTVAITKWLVTKGNWNIPVSGFTDSLKTVSVPKSKDLGAVSLGEGQDLLGVQKVSGGEDGVESGRALPMEPAGLDSRHGGHRMSLD